MAIDNAHKECVPPSQDLALAQAALFSREAATRYRTEHASAGGQTDELKAVIAEARLQWILEATRRSLGGRFSLGEFIDLMDCFQDEIFFLETSIDMAGALVDYRDDLEPLARKIDALTETERLALADVIEQLWHRTRAEKTSPDQICRRLNIRLSSD